MVYFDSPDVQSFGAQPVVVCCPASPGKLGYLAAMRIELRGSGRVAQQPGVVSHQQVMANTQSLGDWWAADIAWVGAVGPAMCAQLDCQTGLADGWAAAAAAIVFYRTNTWDSGCLCDWPCWRDPLSTLTWHIVGLGT